MAASTLPPSSNIGVSAGIVNWVCPAKRPAVRIAPLALKEAGKEEPRKRVFPESVAAKTEYIPSTGGDAIELPPPAGPATQPEMSGGGSRPLNAAANVLASMPRELSR